MYENKYHCIDLDQYSFLVTGGGGFIGSHLVEYLLKYNAKKVRVLDNFSTGSRENTDLFKDNPSFELMEGDIRDPETCEKAMEGIDYVLHHAALGSVPRSINDPITSNNVNVNGFVNVLNAARKAEVKRFVYASSSSTYGDLPDLPKVEHKIGLPISPYAVTKYTNELYANVFAPIYKMQIVGLRYFNIFGPRQNPNGAYAAVIPKFIQQLVNKESPKINGDGSFSRDFTFVENAVQMNMRVLFAEYDQEISEVYNVACAEQTTLLTLIDYIKEYLGDDEISKVQPIFGEPRQGDIPSSLASIDKAKDAVGYDPLYKIREGLEVTVNKIKLS